MSFIKRIVGGLFDGTTFIPRALRSAALIAALWVTGQPEAAVDQILVVLAGLGGMLGAGEMNR